MTPHSWQSSILGPAPFAGGGNWGEQNSLQQYAGAKGAPFQVSRWLKEGELIRLDDADTTSHDEAAPGSVSGLVRLWPEAARPASQCREFQS